MARGEQLIDRLRQHTVIDGDCWRSTYHHLPAGYCRIKWRVDGQRQEEYVHRLSYQLHHGPIPEGTEVHHTCENEDCWNPDHLRAVTHRVNVLLGDAPMARQFRQGACKRGHDFTPENTYVQPGTRKRTCRACVPIRRAARSAA